MEFRMKEKDRIDDNLVARRVALVVDSSRDQIVVDSVLLFHSELHCRRFCPSLTMEFRMKEKDRIDDNLVARRVDDQGDSEKGIRLNVTSPLALSAQFIRLAEAGKLKEISPLVEEHQKVAKRLVLIESKLLACNSPEYLAEFEQYCRSRNRDFPLQLKTVARRKEVQKIKLRKRLASLEKRLLRNKPWLAEWLTSAASETVASAVSLVPTRNPDSD